MKARAGFFDPLLDSLRCCVPALALVLCQAFASERDAATPLVPMLNAGEPGTSVPPQSLTLHSGNVGYESPLRWLSVTNTGPTFGRPIIGNWFDRAHGGHGFDFQLFAVDPTNGHDVYFLTFYTYKSDGTSEWYQAVGSMVDGVFTPTPQSNGNTLYRIIYTTSPTAITGLALDNSVSGSVSVDFNQASQSPTCLSKDRSNALQLAVMSWHIGSDSGQWCVEPIVAPTSHPNPDLNGHWFAPSDSGWGMEVLDVSTGAGSAPTIVIYMYYPGPNGQPTWATASGLLANGSATMPLLQVSDGYCRTCTPPSKLTANNVGTITLAFSQAKAGGAVPAGSATVSANYPGGGGFYRTLIPTQMLSTPFVSTGPLVIQEVSGSGQQGVAFQLPAPIVSGGAQPYHFRFDTFFNGSPPAGSIVDLFSGVVSVPKLNVAGTYHFNICVDDIGGTSDCAPATATIAVSNGSQKPNLTPYQPQGWSDKVVVSNMSGTSSDSSPLLSTDTLYVDWAVTNNGSASTTVRFNTVLYVDGVAQASWYDDPPFDPNHYIYISDHSIGSLSEGAHTIQIVADSPSAISESDESDNQYTKTIQVGTATNTVLTWTVADQCSSGAQMYYKFFDENANLVWPPPPNAYVASEGQTFVSHLSCTSGHQICLGAQSGSYSWGVGLNGTGSCTISGTCGQGPYSNSLTCGGSGGTYYYANWNCGSSSQCANVMGGSVGTEGPFCSTSSCQAWGNHFIQGGYTCSTTPTYAPNPGGSQCFNYP